jgi:hypothetical protein
VPIQRKGARRLRPLLTALVTSLAVAGTFGTASAAPQPTKGILEICKAASGPGVGGFFGFKVQGRPGVIEVPVGYCSHPIELNPGQVTVTEVGRPGFSVEAIATVPVGRLVRGDRNARSALVRVEAGGVRNQTMVTFTNKAKPKGFLEVCKDKPDKDKLDGNFNFTVTQTGSPTQTVTVPVGACSLPIQLLPGEATITEVARTGSQLVGIETTPDDRQRGIDPATGSVRVEIVQGGRSRQTMVTFTNKKVTPPPTTGHIKICKRAGKGVQEGTPFTFTMATQGNTSVVVRAGSCSKRLVVPLGKLTVTEAATPGFEVSDISVDPEEARFGRPNLKGGSVSVDVTADPVATEVEFTNKAIPPGALKLCKIAGTGVVPRTPFSFSVGGKPVTVPAGSCLPMTLHAGKVEITEAPTTGLRVTDITVVGHGWLISKDHATGKAVINLASGGITEVLYTNGKPYNPGNGCVCPGTWFKQKPKDVQRLVPAGGLMVGGDRLTAAQVQAILRLAARGGNVRFELEGELITALLNQLRRTSTPANVQTAVDATQLLLSQTDGALKNGAINTTKLEWWSTVLYKGKTYSAGQLIDTLGSYNEGRWQGGPRPCVEPTWGSHKPAKHKKGKPKWPGSRFAWPI